jgi:hypothetical protein
MEPPFAPRGALWRGVLLLVWFGWGGGVPIMRHIFACTQKQTSHFFCYTLQAPSPTKPPPTNAPIHAANRFSAGATGALTRGLPDPEGASGASSRSKRSRELGSSDVPPGGGGVHDCVLGGQGLGGGLWSEE